ncbi:MAG: biotin/lipoate A/B protein ligase family protein [Candidatus Altiarchaeota archaeon]
MECRLLETGFQKASWNMGVDESVLEHVSEGTSKPTLRIYGWSPPAVSIGYFQSIQEEVDLAACCDMGVDVVRRITGGGAVFHDQELTYSIIIPEKEVPEDILESYRLVCGGITRGLDSLGIESEFAPLNDIVTGGKKISGNAQTRRKHCMLQHGTILLKLDVNRMFRLLKVPSEKMRDKIVENVKERVTSVKDCLGREVSFHKASNAVVNGFAQAMNLELEPGKLSESEMKLAGELAKTKYSSEEWNNKR